MCGERHLPYCCPMAAPLLSIAKANLGADGGPRGIRGVAAYRLWMKFKLIFMVTMQS